ncbi:MAG: hypothetical protein GWP62_05005 [Gammaproteobacteria bacterium]|jgi:hypothetical protein|nr:hypothetical protein [Gammaproteobacteria bacterium]
MFTNKHVVVAMLVAPVLAIMAWFAMDYFIGERPHAAKDGATYTLIAKSNCRYDSGQCDLENSDFTLSIRPVSLTTSSVQLEVTSAFPLQSAALGLVDNGAELLPAPMKPTAEDGLRWTAQIDRPTRANAEIRIAVTAQGAMWFAEVPVVFMKLADEP